jgi:hypothetical protein
MGASMGLLFALVLASAVTNNSAPQQTAETKSARNTEHSLMKQAMDGISVLANRVTPIPSAKADDDKTAESSPAALVWVHMSKKYLADYVERSVDHEKPARENVLGIIFTGQSRTEGKTRLVLHKNDDRATADVEFTGTVHSRTIGHSGPATLQFISESTFRARKPLVVDGSGISTSNATVDAPTRLIPTSVATNLPGLRGRIGNRIARRREAGSRAQAEVIVGRDTANDIRHDFNVKLDAAVAEIQNKVQDQIATLKLNGENGGVLMRSCSTPDFVEVALCPQQAEAKEFDMADSSPFDGNPALAVRVHRSLMASLLANAEVREKFASTLSGAIVGSNSKPADDSSPQIAMSGEWLAIDLSGTPTIEPPQRLAATATAQTR